MIDLRVDKGTFCYCCMTQAVLLIITDEDCEECDSIVAYCKDHACELTDELLDALNPLCIEEMINEE